MPAANRISEQVGAFLMELCSTVWLMLGFKSMVGPPQLIGVGKTGAGAGAGGVGGLGTGGVGGLGTGGVGGFEGELTVMVVCTRPKA